MLRYASGIAAIVWLLCLSAPAQAPTPGEDAKKEAARAAQGYAPVRLWERPDVRAARVEMKPGANRAIHQHDDVKFHLFIPLTGKLQITIGSDKPVDAPVGQAFYIKGGTPHGFRNLGFHAGERDGDLRKEWSLRRQPGSCRRAGCRAAERARAALMPR